MGKDQPFTQRLLSKEQLDAGTYRRIDDIEIPDEAIAMTGCSSTELAERTGISFQKSFDDLDEGNFAVLEFAAGFTVTLKEYFGAPVKGVRIYTDLESQRSAGRLTAVLDGLSLSRDELIWIFPDLE